MNTVKVEKLLKLKWSDPKRVATRQGEKLLRTAPTSDEFWELWRSNKDNLKTAGLSVGKNFRSGQWEVCWWAPLPKADVKAENKARAKSRATNANVKIPAPDGLDYLPFQKAGIAYARERANVLIADEMGLGKTIQAVGIINDSPKTKRVLVVCPASLKINWQREMQKWLVRDLSVGIASSTSIPPTDVVVINYDILKKHEGLTSTEWDVLIADECHYVKNSKAQRSKALFALKAKRRIFLTGTPIPNGRPIEMQGVLAKLDPVTFGNFFAYAKRYCNARQVSAGRNLVWDFSGASNLDELHDKMRRTVMVRRLKKDVLTELPEKTRQVVELEAVGVKSILDKENRAYEAQDSALTHLRVKVALAKCEGQEAYEEAVENLRKAERVAFTEISQRRHDTALAKVPAVLAHLDDLLESGGEDFKVVVFAHHHDVVDAIYQGLSGAVKLDGRMTQADRQASVDRFQNDPTVRVFVGSIQASGVGITLTRSSHVVFAELDWQVASISQAEDRCHRIGQKNSVTVQHLVLDGSLDSKLAKTLVHKQSIISQTLDGELKKELAKDTVTTVTLTASVKELKKLSVKVTPAMKALVHEALRTLAEQCDGATSWDGAGFNKFDSAFGRALARYETLTDTQAVAGHKLCWKYRKQLERNGVTITPLKGGK